MLVSQILSSKANQDVVTVPTSSDVRSAAEVLSVRRIGTVVVSDDGVKALGILSERDIVREIGKQGPEVLASSVSDIMTRKLVTCTGSADVTEVLTKMTDGHFRHMPVVEDGALKGVITLGDVVKARLSEVSMERQALQDMIMGF